MKLSMDQIISIISAVGVSTIISTIFAFVQANKRNNLDFITRERSEWRKLLKSVIVNLNDDREREKSCAIEQLKTQLNPYGINCDCKGQYSYYMKDGYIWNELNKEEQNIDYNKLSAFIELLLKYDWERSKSEVRNNYSTVILIFLNAVTILFILYSFITFDICDYVLWIKDESLIILIKLVLILLFPILILFTIKQKSILDKIYINKINGSKLRILLSLYIKFWLPYVCCIIHIIVLGNKLINVPTIFGIHANFLTNRLILLLISPIFCYIYKYLTGYRNLELDYIDAIKRIEQYYNKKEN